ncbi:MAG: alpha/beta fold hydrolase [Clostridia bacterium]|nr:alpha/beta fold hydrolase [Clostridia bacterium]
MDHREYIRAIDDADTAVFMVHGINSTPRHFDWLIPYLPENWSIYNILLDGHGGSVKDFSNTSMKKWKQQVDGWLRKLSAQYANILVVGYSMGTLLTMELTQKYPCIKAMLLFNVPLKVFVRPVMAVRVLKFSFGKVNKNNPAELATYNDIGMKLEPWLWKYLAWIPHYISLLRLCRQCRKVAPVLNIPCHVLFGKKDELVSVKSKRYFENNPYANSFIFENSGHFYYEPEFKAHALESLGRLIDQINLQL